MPIFVYFKESHAQLFRERAKVVSKPAMPLDPFCPSIHKTPYLVQPDMMQNTLTRNKRRSNRTKLSGGSNRCRFPV